MPAMRELTSGPWQRKHVPDMIGRMSRLKSTGGRAPWSVVSIPAAAYTAAMLKAFGFILLNDSFVDGVPNPIIGRDQSELGNEASLVLIPLHSCRFCRADGVLTGSMVV